MDKLPRNVRLGFLLHDVSRMRRTLFDQALRPLGITRSQWWVLSQLSRHPRRGMLQTELARDLDVGKVTVGGLIDRLESAGYVARSPDQADRRAKRITVTERGRAVMGQMAEVSDRLNGLILAGIGAGELDQAEAILLRMKDNLRRSITDWTEADLPVGVDAPD